MDAKVTDALTVVYQRGDDSQVVAGAPFAVDAAEVDDLNVDPTWTPVLDTPAETLGDIIRWAVPDDGRRFPEAAAANPSWRR